MCTCVRDTSCKQRIKMIEIVNTFLLVCAEFMPDMHLKQRGFTYSACEPFTKNKAKIL